jgi:hypothetical protein
MLQAVLIDGRVITAAIAWTDDTAAPPAGRIYADVGEPRPNVSAGAPACSKGARDQCRGIVLNTPNGVWAPAPKMPFVPVSPGM